MHNNFYFLRQLSKSLEEKLKDYSVVSCFSQNKDELILELNNRSSSFFIKAHLLANFSCLSFPSTFHRAKKNSVDLFDELILKKFITAIQFENERSFSLNFEGDLSLVFKMHGNRANVLLAKREGVIKIFKNQFTDDLSLRLGELHKSIDWSESAFWDNQTDLTGFYFTLGKPVWQYLESQNFHTLDKANKWTLFCQTIERLKSPEFFVVEQREKIRLLLVPTEAHGQQFTEPVDAVNEFFQRFTTFEALKSERQKLSKRLTSKILSCEAFIEKNEGQLREVQHNNKYRLWADLLMANMHQIPRGASIVEVSGFDQNQMVIKLKPELSVQKNAEIYYRKSKNQEIEISKLKESIERKTQELEEAKSQLQNVVDAETLKELKSISLPQRQTTGPAHKEERLPFHKIEFKGFQIWIGKNASSNDELTQNYSFKEDLWLHAKDVAGSHVLIKHQANKTFPKDVIERAAELAAYNSKRKTETLCPVIYTPKKFVRKKKGDPPGTVWVDKEKVIMVTPKL